MMTVKLPDVVTCRSLFTKSDDSERYIEAPVDIRVMYTPVDKWVYLIGSLCAVAVLCYLHFILKWDLPIRSSYLLCLNAILFMATVPMLLELFSWKRRVVLTIPERVYKQYGFERRVVRWVTFIGVLIFVIHRFALFNDTLASDLWFVASVLLATTMRYVLVRFVFASKTDSCFAISASIDPLGVWTLWVPLRGTREEKKTLKGSEACHGP